MIIYVNLHDISVAKLTPNEFTFLYLIYKGFIPIIKKLIKQTEFINVEQILSLAEKGFLIVKPAFKVEKYENSLVNLDITDKFKALVPMISEDPSQDLLLNYPMKVTRPDGTEDYLRVISRQDRERYNKMVKASPHLHLHILKCLNFEIKERTRTNSLKYTKKLSNWLKTDGWTVYEQAMENIVTDKSTIKTSYGTELL